MCLEGPRRFTSLDIQSIDVPKAVVDGNQATIDGASMEYTTHFAPNTFAELKVAGTVMCRFDLHLDDAEWRVFGGACNEGG